MEGKEAIIKRILDDATAKSNAIIKKANEDAAERKADADDWAKRYEDAQNKILEQDAKDIVSRRITVADLDVRKLLLKTKQDIIDEVKALALKKLCALDKKDYMKLLSSLLEENAEDNDGVILAKNGKATKEDLIALPIYKSKNLKYVSSDGDFFGGAVLIGSKCDIDISFSSLLQSRNDEITSSVAEELFGN